MCECAVECSPSKLNIVSAVPETEDTIITPAATRLAVADDTRHSTVVPLVHDDVAQSMDARVAVGVRLVGAKTRPLSVAVRPPDKGEM